MRILVVASYNKGRFAPFIIEQAEALKRQGCELEWFGLQGKGLRGYLKNYPLLKQKICDFRPDVVHAHFGLSGLFANMQRSVPVVTTYHGSDVNEKKLLPFSKLSMFLSAWNIFVSKQNLQEARPKNRFSLLPCGIELSELQLTEKSVARKEMGLNGNMRYVLFAGSYERVVKNATLAKEVVSHLQDGNVELIELEGYSHDEVMLLLCAVDALLMTSLNEGSPQVIKEALACGCPIVSVDVGDVLERTENVEGCYVTSNRNPHYLAELLSKAIGYGRKTDGRKRIISDGLDNVCIAETLVKIYHQVVRK